MERKMSNMSTASSKLRNLKEFLSSTRLSQSQSQAQISQNPPPNSTTSQADYRNGAVKIIKTKKSPKTSMSLFNIMSATSREGSQGSKRESNRGGRPVSAAFDDLEPYGYPSPPTKSISMFGLAPSDELPDNPPPPGYHYNQCGTSRTNFTSRNFAARLFQNIRSKFRKRRRDRNKIVDSKSSDFGSFLGDRMKSPLDRSYEGDDDKSTHSSTARQPLKSSRSVDNVLESLFGSRRLRSVAFEFNEGIVDENRTAAHSYSNDSDEEDGSSSMQPFNRDTYTSDNVFDESVGSNSQNQSNFLLPAIIGGGGSISPSSATSSPAKPIKCLTKELEDLLHFGWYWAGLSKEEAEAKLAGQPDGAFIVRDSSSDHYLLSLSFNSNGRTLHTRIEYRNGQFSFYSSDADCFPTVAELIDHCIAFSELGVFCYSRARRSDRPSYPVRLTKPISRYTEVKSLLYLSRFVLRQYVRLDLIPQLPLPQTLIEFVSEQRYI